MLLLFSLCFFIPPILFLSMSIPFLFFNPSSHSVTPFLIFLFFLLHFLLFPLFSFLSCFPHLFTSFSLLLFIYFLLQLFLLSWFLSVFDFLHLTIFLPLLVHLFLCLLLSFLPIVCSEVVVSSIDRGSDCCACACEQRWPASSVWQAETPWLPDRWVTIRLVPAPQLAAAHLHKWRTMKSVCKDQQLELRSPREGVAGAFAS
jgi:hypothetical protein